MLTLGVDLATKDARTALCLIRWGDGPPRLEHLVARDVSDGMITARASDADVVAIDAPFGWPIPFVDAVGGYAAGSPWPRQQPAGLWLRRTDLVVQAALGGRFPLSVSSDRIARPAERAGGGLAGEGLAVDRPGFDKSRTPREVSERVRRPSALKVRVPVALAVRPLGVQGAHLGQLSLGQWLGGRSPRSRSRSARTPSGSSIPIHMGSGLPWDGHAPPGVF